MSISTNGFHSFRALLTQYLYMGLQSLQDLSYTKLLIFFFSHSYAMEERKKEKRDISEEYESIVKYEGLKMTEPKEFLV